MLPFHPLPCESRADPFDDPDWIFEVKHDGYRALAHLEAGKVRLVSRRGREFNSYAPLAIALAKEIQTRNAVLDGELVCLDAGGKSIFADMRRRLPPVLIAFDLLKLGSQDLRERPLRERKLALRTIIPEVSSHLLYLHHIAGRGRDLFEAACRMDLEGIVAKKADAPYDVKRARWWKIKNPAYSQGAGRSGSKG